MHLDFSLYEIGSNLNMSYKKTEMPSNTSMFSLWMEVVLPPQPQTLFLKKFIIEVFKPFNSEKQLLKTVLLKIVF